MPMTWPQILALFINGVGVAVILKLAVLALPYLEVRIPWALPILGMLAGPLVAMVQSWLTGWLGVPIDLSPLLVPLSTAGAILFHQERRRVLATGGRWTAQQPLL